MNNNQPVRPSAEAVRRALRTAGLLGHLRKVTSGRKFTYAHLTFQTTDDQAQAVVDALRSLWNDGRSRVTLAHRVIAIDRRRWFDTRPADTTEQAKPVGPPPPSCQPRHGPSCATGLLAGRTVARMFAVTEFVSTKGRGW
jgi:hypothetical protein